MWTVVVVVRGRQKKLKKERKGPISLFIPISFPLLFGKSPLLHDVRLHVYVNVKHKIKTESSILPVACIRI